MQTPLILVGNRTKSGGTDSQKPAEDLNPRQDYAEIGRKLDGQLLGYDLSNASWYQWVRRIEKHLKLDVVECLAAAAQLGDHNVVLSTSEKLALPLAALMRIQRKRIPHVVIGHKLSSGYKARLLHASALRNAFSHMICLCAAQADFAVHQLGIPADAVDLVYDGVDHRFFRPRGEETRDFVLVVGQEQRDYRTLLRALSGTGLRLVVVASSPWSTNGLDKSGLGQATVLSHIPYRELRSLYSQARLVVVPLFDVDYAAGVNTVLEAMAMGKPLIVSRSRGITDYLVQGETGHYVAPGDAPALRDAILSLWEHSPEQTRLGRNARQAVEEGLNLDNYAERVAQIVRQVAAMPTVEPVYEGG